MENGNLFWDKEGNRIMKYNIDKDILRLIELPLDDNLTDNMNIKIDLTKEEAKKINIEIRELLHSIELKEKYNIETGKNLPFKIKQIIINKKEYLKDIRLRLLKFLS